MPTDPEAIDALMRSLRSAGVLVTAYPDTNQNPCTIGVQGLEVERLIVHLRRITPQQSSGPIPSDHGRPSGEWHTQMVFDGARRGKGIKNTLRSEANAMTLLLGYARGEDGTLVYAAYDPQVHNSYSYSKSLQVQERTLILALTDGVAFQRRASGEIIVAFSEAQFPTYLEHARQFHTLSATELQSLERASQPVQPQPIDLPTSQVPRSRTISSISRFVRDRKFSRAIRTVYERCAICWLSFHPLLEGAHIIPVAEEGSTDTYDNGLGLCPTCHDLYDMGYVLVDGAGQVLVNASKLQASQASGELLDEAWLRSHIHPTIWQPESESHRPSPEKLGHIFTKRSTQA